MAAAVSSSDGCARARESHPQEKEFFVHRNSPLAILIQHEQNVFGLLLPWIYDLFANKQLVPVLKDSAWKLAHEITEEQAQQATNSIRTLPLMCFRFGAVGFSDHDKKPSMKLDDPFVDNSTDWVPVSQEQLIVVMRIVNEFMSRARTPPSMMPEFGAPNLSNEVLDRILPITWVIDNDKGDVLIRYGPNEPHNKLTLRKLLGMLMDMPYLSTVSDQFHARYIYVASVAESNYFAVHRSVLGKRYEPLQWQVVVRSSGEHYAPRLATFDVMQDIYKRFESAVMLRDQMGPNGAL